MKIKRTTPVVKKRGRKTHMLYILYCGEMGAAPQTVYIALVSKQYLAIELFLTHLFTHVVYICYLATDCAISFIIHFI